MINHNHPRDLDMSDVLADADRMFSEFLDLMVDDDEITLRINRYDYGPDARQGEPHAIAVVETCDYLIPRPCYREFGDHDHDPARCAMILDNMNASWDDGFADAYNRELEAESLGRPLFPNEY